MPHISEMLASKYLKKEDLQRPALFTIAAVRREPIKDPKTGESEEKWLLYFEEDDRALVLNKTNIHKMGELAGEDTDSWIGHKVVLYNDATVSYGGKSGGIRIRARKMAPKAVAAATAPLALNPAYRADLSSDVDDDIPF